MKRLFENKKILVTGGTGSIGSEIVRRLLKYNPAVVRIFSNEETEQFNFMEELKGNSNVRFLLGDIRDKERLKKAMHGIDIVFHAAALKHVSLCEYNSFEAVKTNIIGTQNVIDAAIEENVGRVISISTDKAANPTSVMGVTKLLSEKLVSGTYYYVKRSNTKFCSVRFGNVLGSRGSVVPLFKKQISQGYLTLTHPEMTRFVMSTPRAVDLVFKAAELSQMGEVFIFKMPSIRIKDLAEVMIAELSSKETKIEIIGTKPGEKLHEDLMTAEESKNALETKDMFIVLPSIATPHLKPREQHYPGAKKTTISHYSSNDAKLLSKEELKVLLNKTGLL